MLTSPCTGTQARPPQGGDEAGVLQLHGRVEVMVADMGLVIWAQWGVQPYDMIYLVMDGHRKLVVHNYRNLMVATMMYCTATGT